MVYIKTEELATQREALANEQRSCATLRQALKQKSKHYATKEEEIRQEMDRDFKAAVESVRKYLNATTTADGSIDLLHIDNGEDTDCSFTSQASSERAVAPTHMF